MDNYRWPMAHAAENFANQVALIDKNQSLTFSQYAIEVGRIATNLHNAGVQPGNRLALLGGNSIDYALVLMGTFQANATACPLSTRLPADTVRKQLEFLQCSHMVLFDDSDKTKVPGEVLTSSQLRSENSGHIPLSDVSPDHPSSIMFTSGSSDEPKAVLHTTANHYYSALGSNMNIPFVPGDRWLLSLPLYHVGGLGILFRSLLGGGAVVVPSEPSDLFDAIHEYDITHLSVVSTQLNRLCDRLRSDQKQLNNVKAVLLGGGSAPESLIEAAVDLGLPLFTSYGLTEMASQVTTTSPNDTGDKLKTAGKSLSYREICLASDGEILVRGKTLFSGYVNRDGLGKSLDDKGWFATGDIGTTDSDGYLRVIGRKDAMFISGGENIHPEEIERALLGLANVNEAIVVGIDDPEFGQRPVAFVRMTTDGKKSEEPLRTELEHVLPAFKIPAAFLPWPEESSTTGIKAQRRQFAKIAAKHQKQSR
jgi:O-succinylbenzoic acid--CoA ligase